MLRLLAVATTIIFGSSIMFIEVKTAFPSTLFVLMSAAATTALADSPSFDCNKARRPDEIAICGNPTLAWLDRIASTGYAYLKEEYGRQFADRIGIPAWEIRQACKSNVYCIQRAQIEAINAYRAAGAPVSVPNVTSQTDSKNLKSLKRREFLKMASNSVIWSSTESLQLMVSVTLR